MTATCRLSQRSATCSAASLDRCALAQEQADHTLSAAVGGGVQRRPARLVAHLNIETLGEQRLRLFHVIAIADGPQIACAEFILIASSGHWCVSS